MGRGQGDVTARRLAVDEEALMADAESLADGAGGLTLDAEAMVEYEAAQKADAQALAEGAGSLVLAVEIQLFTWTMYALRRQ